MLLDSAVDISVAWLVWVFSPVDSISVVGCVCDLIEVFFIEPMDVSWGWLDP